MKAAAFHASSAGAVRMELATAVTNDAAQRLYESLSWQPDVAFLRYTLSLPGS